MSFWNPRMKWTKEVEALEKRLKHNSEIIAEDHAEIVELKSQNSDLAGLIKALSAKVDALEAKQVKLRDGLFSGLTNLDQPGMQFSTDHICGSLDITPTFCKYCFEQDRYDGSKCGCSPQGYPHSGHCKGYDFTKGSAYEDLK